MLKTLHVAGELFKINKLTHIPTPLPIFLEHTTVPVQWGLWAAQSVQHPLKTAFCLPGRAAACAGVQRAAGADPAPRSACCWEHAAPRELQAL